MVATRAPEMASVAAPAGPPPTMKSESKNLNFYYGSFQALKNINMPIFEKKVTALINRLQASEARLRAIRNDSATHAKNDAETMAQLRAHEQSIAELRATVEQQRNEIAMLEQKVSTTALARRMAVSEGDLQRLLDLDHRSDIGQIEAALTKLGKRLEIRVSSAA